MFQNNITLHIVSILFSEFVVQSLVVVGILSFFPNHPNTFIDSMDMSSRLSLIDSILLLLKYSIVYLFFPILIHMTLLSLSLLLFYIFLFKKIKNIIREIRFGKRTYICQIVICIKNVIAIVRRDKKLNNFIEQIIQSITNVNVTLL